MTRVLGAILLALALGPALADTPTPGAVVPNGFYTGNQIRKFPADIRAVYVAGVFDGLLYAPAMGGDEVLAETLKQCVVGMNPEQVSTSVDKYLAAHPEQWNWPMNVIVISAIEAVCPAFKKASKSRWE